VQDAVHAQRELQESKDDLEKDYNDVRARLERVDPQYRRENQLYHEIVQRLKRHRVSVTQAFELFDVNNDGQLSRGELRDALTKMGLDDLSDREVDMLTRSFDLDGDGSIQYKEFARKLERCGLRSLSTEEMLVFNIIKTLKRLNMTKADLFKFINKDGEGTVTRKDFADMLLSSLNLKGVGKDEVAKFVDFFYKDEKGGVDLGSFQRIFEKYERQIEMDENPSAAHEKRQRPRIPTRILKMKKKVFEQVAFALND